MSDSHPHQAHGAAPLVVVYDCHHHATFACQASFCKRIQRVDQSKDDSESGRCNRCLKPRVNRDRHRHRLYQCHLCRQEKVKHNVRAVGDAWECRRCIRAKAYASLAG